MSGDSKDGDERSGRGPEEARLMDDARNLALDGLVDVLAGIHRAKQAREDASERRTSQRTSGSGGPPRVELDSAQTAGDFFYELARMQLDIVDRVLKFQRKHADFLVERLRGAPASSDVGGAGGGLVVVTGAKGEKCKATFVIENRSTKNAYITLRLSELRSRDGEPPFIVKAEFDWKSGDALGPDQERTVSLTLTLDSPRFQAGHRYRGHIEIMTSGRPKRTLPLRIDVAPDGGDASGRKQEGTS
jgi:hypothetical protein